MKPTRWWLAVLGLAAMTALNGCHCGADEQFAVNISAIDSVTVVSGGATRRIGGPVRLSSPPINSSAFQFVFATVEGSASGEGIALSFSGLDPKTNEVVIVGLALPVALRQGEEYAVGAKFEVEATIDGDPRLWGPYDLAQSDRAEAGFVIASYSFPPPQYTTSFRAVTSSGTVRVAKRQRGSLELVLNLNFVDANGKTAAVTGRLQATTERTTLPCFR